MAYGKPVKNPVKRKPVKPKQPIKKRAVRKGGFGGLTDEPKKVTTTNE